MTKRQDKSTGALLYFGAVIVCVALTASGCGGDPCGGTIPTCADGFTYDEASCECVTSLSWKPGESLGTPINCSATDPCTGTLVCATVVLADGPTLPICVETTVCDQLDCASGQCALVTDTDPGEIVCQG